ncbi:hypothetical protein Q5P01_000172, partial [Channa striata]
SSLSPPVLTVFPPSSAELQSNKVSLVCLSSQSVPFADVTWSAAGSPVSSGISTSTAVQQPDQTFRISSSLEIQTSDWNTDKVYKCSSLSPPVLTVFPPSSAELQSNKVSLVCLSSQSVPFADVTWSAAGSPVSSGISTSTAVQQPDQTFRISSSLEIQTSDWNTDKVYKCTKLTVTGSSLPPPVLTVFPPSSAELQSNKVSLVCLSSQSVPFADVTWSAAGSPVSSGISTSTAVQQPDQTFRISSSLEIQTSDWNTDKVYKCKVSLGSQFSEKSISKSKCPTEGQ